MRNRSSLRYCSEPFVSDFLDKLLLRPSAHSKRTEVTKMPEDRCKIVRAQSSLAPMLNSPCSPAARSIDCFTTLADDHTAPVHLVVRSVRVLAMAIGLALGLGTICSVLIVGVRLKEPSAKNLSDSDKSSLLDRYNTYSGLLFSLVGMPFQQIVMLLVPVFFLCFATSAIVNENRSIFQAWAPVGATLATALLIGQGMDTVNVQFGSPRIESIIESNDLGSTSSAQLSFTVTNTTSSMGIAGIPSSERFYAVPFNLLLQIR